MARTTRFRLICQGLAAFFLLVAVTRLAVSFFPIVDPLLTLPAIGCEECSYQRDPVTLLEPQSARKRAWQTPGAAERIVQRLEEPKVRLMLVSAHLIRALPFFLVFGALAMALRSLAQKRFSSDAIRWLRRAAFASIVWALGHPIAQSVLWTAFSPITHGRELSHIVLDVSSVVWPVLLSGAVWVCVWALEEAMALQQDLEEYV